MNTNEEWLRKKVAQEDGCYVSVGGFIQTLEQSGLGTGSGAPIKQAFVRFVQLARRERRLSLEQFAKAADVDLAELLNIETEEHCRPSLSPVHNIASFLAVPHRKLMALAGMLEVDDAQFQEVALKFAARSVPVRKLSKEEHSDLERIVKLLCER